MLFCIHDVGRKVYLNGVNGLSAKLLGKSLIIQKGYILYSDFRYLYYKAVLITFTD